MNAIFYPVKCTCVLRCTSNRAATLFCSFKKDSKNNAKRFTPTKFTNVHKYTGRFFNHFWHVFSLITSIKVIKSYVFMYISEHTDDRGLFLPCNLSAFLPERPDQCTSKKGKYTKVHGGGLFYAKH